MTHTKRVHSIFRCLEKTDTSKIYGVCYINGSWRQGTTWNSIGCISGPILWKQSRMRWAGHVMHEDWPTRWVLGEEGKEQVVFFSAKQVGGGCEKRMEKSGGKSWRRLWTTKNCDAVLMMAIYLYQIISVIHKLQRNDLIYWYWISNW